MNKFFINLWRFALIELRGFSHTLKIDDHDQCVSDVGTSYSNTNSARSCVKDITEKDLGITKDQHANPSIEFDPSVDHLASEPTPERKYALQNDSINEAIPQNLLIHMGKLPCYFEKIICYSVLTCLDSLLFEITFMPIQAINALSHFTIKALIFAYKELYTLFYDCFFLTNEHIHSIANNPSSVNADEKEVRKTKIGQHKTFYGKKSNNDNVDSLSEINLILDHISGERKKRNVPLTTSEFCGFVRFFVLVTSVLFFSNLDTSRLYHNIRGQPFIKLYVIFNMLEICERLCRSFGLDAMDSLMRTTIRIFNILNSNSPGNPFSERGLFKTVVLSESEPDQRSEKYKIIKVEEDKNSICTISKGNKKSFGRCSDTDSKLYVRETLANKFGCESPRDYSLETSFDNTSTFNMFKSWDTGSNIYYKFAFLYFLVVVTVSFHSFLHLARVLSINIAINSSESAMFLLLITNNFAEIKSTVFKKYNYVSLFIIFASDAVERSYLLCDGLNIFLKMLESKRDLKSYLVVLSWLLAIYFIEMLIDLVKHGYLLKFNKIKSETFESYRASLIADTLLSRCRHNINSLVKIPFKIPYRGAYSFSHIPSRRLGFVPSPFITLIICSLPRIRSRLNLELLISALAIWISLVILKVVSSVLLLAYSIKRKSKIYNLDLSFSKIGPL